MTETEKLNQKAREGKISPQEYYVRVKQDAANGAEKAADGASSNGSSHNGKRQSILTWLRHSKTPAVMA